MKLKEYLQAKLDRTTILSLILIVLMMFFVSWVEIPSTPIVDSILTSLALMIGCGFLVYLIHDDYKQWRVKRENFTNGF